MVKLVAFAALLTACLQPELVACGDLACPAGTTCLGDRCVTSEQLSACDAHGEGDVCSIGGAVGRCTTGACIPVGCGNGVVEQGEVCDDGNTRYRDGCAGDCASTETCGNGIVDVVAGESCDCGDGSVDVARCRGPNSDDLDAECSTTCTLRYCGDGALDDLEQCDDTALAGRTCGDFGFYGGDLACSSSCRFAVDACSGRCGDHVVDPTFGEFCDGTAPSQSCIEVGFDAGSLACSTSCTPDPATCEGFGWHRIDSAAAIAMWGGDDLAIVVSASGAAVVINDLATPAPAGAYVLAAGSSGTGFAIGATTIAVWAGTTWTTLVPGWASGTPTAAWASPAGELYVVVDGALWHRSGSAWATEPTPVGAIAGLTGSSSGLLVWSATALAELAGGTWTSIEVPSGTIAHVATSATARWLVLADDSIWREVAGGDWLALGPQPHVAAIATNTAGHLFAIAGNAIQRYTGIGPPVTLGSPGVAVATLAVSDDAGIVAAGASGTFRLRTAAWIDRTFIRNAQHIGNGVHVHLNANGSQQLVTTAGFYHSTDDGATYDYSADDGVHNGAQDFLQLRDGSHVFAGDTIIVQSPSYDQVVVATESASHLAIAANGEVIAWGGSNLVRGGIPTSLDWQVIATPGYVIDAAELDATGAIVAVAHTSPTAYVALRIDAAGIVELPGSATPVRMRAIYAAPDGTVVMCGGDAVVTLANGTATTVHLDGADLRSISGSSATDVFVVGFVVPFTPFTGMAHFDGTAWTSVRIPTNTIEPFEIRVSAERIVYLAEREVYSLGRLVRW